MFSKVTIVSVLAGLAAAQVNPLTVTSVSPAQSSALFNAGASYGSRLLSDPALNSLVAQLATNTPALSAFTGVLGSFTALPTGTAAIARVNSLIDTLPSAQASFLHSLLSAEVSIASSVLNDPSLATGSAGSASGSASGTSRAASGSASGTTVVVSSTRSAGTSGTAGAVTQSGNNAAPTAAYVQAAGLALGAFGAAVAML